MPLNFTLTYNDGINDADDLAGDIARVGTWGPMWFEPMFSTAGARLVSPDGATCPVQFSGFIDNGVLKTKQGGTIDVRLWANDPAWELDRFQYRVRADLTDARGRPIPWDVFYFDAPKEDRVVPLKLEIPRPGQKFGRGRPAIDLVGVALNGSKQLVLTREDGYQLTTAALALDDSIGNSNSFGAAYGMTFGA